MTSVTATATDTGTGKATYKVAIIGTGRMGGLIEDEIPVGSSSKPYGHYPAYHHIAETEVVAVANRGEERLERFSKRFGITNTYLDYREMILKEQPDIVSITTPSLRRAEPIIFCAENGVKAIFAEKGLCASLEEADRIAEAVRRNKVAFNWGTLRRYNNAFKQLAAEIAGGAIGEPRAAVMSFATDLIKHHPHTIDLVEMLLGDPNPLWVEGELIEPGEPWAPDRPLPTLDREGHRYVAPEGREIGDPWVGTFRVKYDSNAEGIFLPIPGPFDIDVYGTEGRAWACESANEWGIRTIDRKSGRAVRTTWGHSGESATVNAIRELINELETGERTTGNIDRAMKVVEQQFALLHSSLDGGARTPVPVEDRSFYVPGG
jgi:predicted dehydrogenase